MSTYTFRLEMLSEAEVDVEADSYEEAWEEAFDTTPGGYPSWAEYDFDLVESWHAATEVDGARLMGSGEGTDNDRSAIIEAAVKWFTGDDHATNYNELYKAVEAFVERRTA